MTKHEVLEGLKTGRVLRCDRRDEPLLPWLLNHPSIEHSEVIQADEQSSYIEFQWNGERDEET
jgi:hypothetical protein